MECQGGNGYVEELPLARLYREAPVNAIWEGSGNVMALDILRAAGRRPDAARATIAALAKSASTVIDLGPTVAALYAALAGPSAESGARRIAETLAKLATVAALVENGSPFAGLYAASRLAGGYDQLGAADIPMADQTKLLDRALRH
jgi:putative acyl-CoA dehydrogenase